MGTPIDQFLNILAKKDGSDLYLSTGAPPCAKFQGVLRPLAQEAYQAGQIEQIANQIMDSEQREIFAKELEMNLAISIPGVGRFRTFISDF